MKKLLQQAILVTSLLWGVQAYAGEGMKPMQSMQEGESLKVIMQQLNVDYAALNIAIFMEDYVAAADAAQNIAYHDTVPMATKKKLKASLGKEMKMFKQADMKVHHLALDIEKAAQAKDMKTMIAKQSQMLSACMACHTSFRSRVIDILR